MNADRKQVEEILQKHNGSCKYYVGVVQMIPYDVAIDAMIEYANLPRIEITEEEITAIKSEEELTRLLKRAEGAYNATGKSDVALGWRHCFDWVFSCISERKEQKTTETITPATEILRKHLGQTPSEFQNLGKRNTLAAMEEYAEQATDNLSKLYEKPRQVLKPLEDLWRKENSPDKFCLPDTTEFYKWIVKKIMDK
jgi:hypothetical protein